MRKRKLLGALRKNYSSNFEDLLSGQKYALTWCCTIVSASCNAGVNAGVMLRVQVAVNGGFRSWRHGLNFRNG